MTVKGPAKSKKKPSGRRYGPGRPTLDDLQQRKQRILDIAMSLFLERGYAEASLVDIAKQAGVATRTIYQHYGDKAAIFRSMVDERIIATQVELPKIDPDQELFEVLLAAAHHICFVAFAGEAIPVLRLMIAESRRFPDLMRRIFESAFNRLLASVAGMFERLAQARRISSGNHAETAKIFIDLLLGAAPLKLAMSWADAGPSEKEIRQKVALFIAGRFGLTVTAAGRVKNTAARRRAS